MCGSDVMLCVVLTCDSSDNLRVIPCVTCVLFWCYLRVMLARSVDRNLCVVFACGSDSHCECFRM